MVRRASRYVALAATCLALVGCSAPTSTVGATAATTPAAAPSPVPAAVTTEGPFPKAGYGFGDGAQMAWLSSRDVNRELDAVAKTKATWLRVLVPWSHIELAKGQYQWNQLDVIVAAATARNLKVLGVIAFSPEWAHAPGAYFTSPPTNASDYAAFASAVVKRYGTRVSNWQLWNEPNLPLFFGFQTGTASRYTELVKAAYPMIKAAQPESTVVLAGLSRMGGPDSPPAFLDAMYAAGVKGSFDAAAAHPYVFPTGLAANPENGWSDVDAVHAVMTANGDGDKKIWMTELGAPTCDCSDGVTAADQAQQITDVLAAAAATGYSGPAFVYSIRDVDSANRADREANFGSLLTSDWQPKAAAGVLAR